MECAYRKSGKRIQRVLFRILLANIGCCVHKLNSFHISEKALPSKIILAHRDKRKPLGFMRHLRRSLGRHYNPNTNKRNTLYAHIKTSHTVVVSLSTVHGHPVTMVTFRNRSIECHVITKRMHWRTSCSECINRCNDRNNLIFIFDPFSLVSDLSKASMGKIIRCAKYRSIYLQQRVHAPVSSR